MDHSALPAYQAGPYPLVYSSEVDEVEQEVQLDVALLIDGMPNILAATAFPFDETWERIREALESGDSWLQVSPMSHEEETAFGVTETFPSVYVGLQCANGERLVLCHIRGLDPGGDPEDYAQEVIEAIRRGLSPEELGVTLDD